MRETLEFRVLEEHASRYFLPSVGSRVSELARKIEVVVGEPLFEQLKRATLEVRGKGELFFGGWMPHRTYTAKELATAELFQFQMPAYFEPAGTACGTVYDESVACPHCGAGRRLVGELILDLGKAPKGKDFAQTIAGDEWIVSGRLADLMQTHGMTGATFEAVRSLKKRREGSPVWYRLNITAPPVEVAAPTRFGVDPFDDDPAGRHRCPKGHVAGLNVLSELSVNRDSWGGADIAVTRQAVGDRQGVLVPFQLIVISPRLRQLLIEHNIKGFKTEVAYLV